jgi:hypothetical protein
MVETRGRQERHLSQVENLREHHKTPVIKLNSILCSILKKFM